MKESIESRVVACPICGAEAITDEDLIRATSGRLLRRQPRPGGFLCWNGCSPEDWAVTQIARLD